MNPSLSLCIPAYNAGLYLPRLLNSAKNQQAAFSEILVYNDCSTDNTALVAEEHGAKVISGKKNIGCSAAKNELAKIASGNWLFFIDADDELGSNFISIAERWMQREGAADIILMRYRYLDALSGKVLDEPYYNAPELKKDPVKYVIENKIVNFELIRKSAFLQIEGFDLDPHVLFIEDRAFAVKAALAGLSFDAEEEVTCVKYRFEESMSSANMDKWPEAGYHLWAKTFKAVGNKYSCEIAEQLYQNAIWAAKANQWDTVRKSIRLAGTITPHTKPMGSSLFQFFFKRVPFSAFYLREMILRSINKSLLK